MADPDFEEQLRLEAAEQKAAAAKKTKVDEDGTVFEWDEGKKAWFPMVDDDFIAKYQMTYGVDTSSTTESSVSSTTGTDTTSTNTSAQDYSQWYSQHYQGTTGGSENLTEEEKKRNEEYWKQYYNYYYHHQQQGEKEDADDKDGAKEGSDKDGTDEKAFDPASQEYSDYWAWYHHYYGHGQGDEATKEDTEAEQTQDGGKDEKKPSSSAAEKPESTETKDAKSAAKRKEKPLPSWFEMSEEDSTHVYLSGLPADIKEEELRELMNKCGLIMYDPITRKPKLKIYKGPDGKPKGDALCCYIKKESVELALQIIDGYNLRGSTLHAEQARFEMKGSYDPKKRRRKLTNKEKKKAKELQTKLLDWRPGRPLGSRPKSDKVIVIKNVFKPQEFELDPTLYNDIRDDIREEASKYGEVRKIMVYDRNEDGVVTVTFQEPEEADLCKEAFNGRWFAKRQLTAETWDGSTKYMVEETEEQKQARLNKWEQFLESDAKNANSQGQGSSQTSTASDTGSSSATNSEPEKQPDSGEMECDSTSDTDNNGGAASS